MTRVYTWAKKGTPLSQWCINCWTDIPMRWPLCPQFKVQTSLLHWLCGWNFQRVDTFCLVYIICLQLKVLLNYLLDLLLSTCWVNFKNNIQVLFINFVGSCKTWLNLQGFTCHCPLFFGHLCPSTSSMYLTLKRNTIYKIPNIYIPWNFLWHS